METEKDSNLTIFLRVGTEMKAEWTETIESIGYKQTTAGQKLVRWFLDLPRDEQVALLGGVSRMFSASRLSRLSEPEEGAEPPKQDFTQGGLAKATDEDKPRNIQRKKRGR